MPTILLLYMKLCDLNYGVNISGDNLHYKDFKNGNYPSMVAYFNSIDWDMETGNMEPSLALDRFHYHVNLAI